MLFSLFWKDLLFGQDSLSFGKGVEHADYLSQFLFGDVFRHLDNNPAPYTKWDFLPAVEEGLKRYTGIRLLRNQHVAVDVNGYLLHLVGVDDLGHDWARGLESHPILSQLLTIVPPGQPTILLSHRPDLFVQAARSGIGLTLSGHTHGGQLALPRFWFKRNLNLAAFITTFNRGLYERGGVFLYVNRGLGVTGQRIRLFTPREIALITLSTN